MEILIFFLYLFKKAKIQILTRKVPNIPDDPRDIDLEISVLNDIENIMELPKEEQRKCEM